MKHIRMTLAITRHRWMRGIIIMTILLREEQHKTLISISDLRSYIHCDRAGGMIKSPNLVREHIRSLASRVIKVQLNLE